MKLKISDIDTVGTLRSVMEAIMDGGTTPPSVAAAAVPRLLAGDIARMGGPEAIIDWAIAELKKRGAVENGDGELRVTRPYFSHHRNRVNVLAKETREKLSRASHAQFQAARIWNDVVKRGQLYGRSIENPELLVSIRRNGYQPELGKVILDENGVIIDGRGRRWALAELGIPLSPAFVQRRVYGEGIEADAHRLADCITANIGRGLSTATIKAIAVRVLPEGGTLDELCETLGYHHLSNGLKKEVALGLHAQEISNRSIARILGVGSTTVDRWVPRNGAPGGGNQNDSSGATRRSKSSDPVIREKVKSLRALGWTRDEICEELGVSHGTVTSHFSALKALAEVPKGACRICGHAPHECEVPE